MALEILGLFTTPDQYQLAQQQAQQAEAAKYAQLDPRAQAQYGFYRGGQQLTNAIGGALGIEDPQLKIISNRQALAGQLDQTNPDSFKRVAKMAAESGDPQFAMAVAQAGMSLESNLATARKTTAEAKKAEYALSQDENLRNALSQLPSDATEDDILRVVTQFGSPDKVLTAIQQSASKRQEIESRQQIEKDKIAAKTEQQLRELESKKEIALMNAKSEKERAQIMADAKTQAAQLIADSKEQLARLVASLKPPPAPALTTIQNPDNPEETITVDARVYKGGGKNAPGVIGAGKPTAFQEKTKALKQQQEKDLGFAIKELENATKDGGLIDQSTGSGAGRLYDETAGFFGQSTSGAEAIGKLKPIQDLVLKMVPRFEGPQSDKDTQSYKEASGQLADATKPTKIRKEAGRTVLRLMKERKKQFVSPELAAEGIGAGGGTPPPAKTPSGQTTKGTRYQVLPD